MFRSRAMRKVEEAGYDPDRLPPGQYLTEKWPVLHAGTVPDTDLATWDFRVFGEVESLLRLSWDEFTALPTREITTDIHCVTRWSRFDTSFKGVHWSDLAKIVKPKPSARYVLARRAGFHSERAARGARGRGGPPRLRSRRRAAHPRARLAAQARDPQALLLEERQVAPRDRAARPRRGRFLGAPRVPQRG